MDFAYEIRACVTPQTKGGKPPERESQVAAGTKELQEILHQIFPQVSKGLGCCRWGEGMTDAANFGLFLHQIFLGSIQDVSCIKGGDKTHDLRGPGLTQHTRHQ